MAFISFSANDGFFTSGNDIEQEGRWVWDATQTVILYHRWGQNQPQASDGQYQDCLILYGMFRPYFDWNDSRCQSRQGFICEK